MQLVQLVSHSTLAQMGCTVRSKVHKGFNHPYVVESYQALQVLGRIIMAAERGVLDGTPIRDHIRGDEGREVVTEQIGVPVRDTPPRRPGTLYEEEQANKWDNLMNRIESLEL